MREGVFKRYWLVPCVDYMTCSIHCRRGQLQGKQVGRVVHSFLLAGDVHQKPQQRTGGACGASLAVLLNDGQKEFMVCSFLLVFCLLFARFLSG